MTPGDATTRSLAGTWGFRLDPERRGVAERWFGGAMPDSIALPGSTDDAGYGRENDAREVTYLTRTHVFEGLAWYQKEIEIPPQWAGKSVLLFLERCLWETELWVDEEPVGYCDSLLTPHVYDLTRWASPGAHRLTLMVDSTPRGTPKRFRNHAYTEHTQTVWNGVIGRIELSCRDPIHLADVQVYPNVAGRSIRIVSKIGNDAGGTAEGTLSCSVRPKDSPEATPVTARQSFAAGGIHQPTVVTELSLGSDTPGWEVLDGEIRPYLVQPRRLGLPHATPDDLRGGDPAANAATMHSVLAGATGPIRDAVVLNSGAALVAGDVANTLPEGIEMAAASIADGRAAEKLNGLVALTRELSPD